MSTPVQNLSERIRRSFARRLRNNQYEVSPAGVLFPRDGVFIGGHFQSWVNGEDEQVDPNTMTLQGLTYGIKAMVAGFAQISTWYVAPFSADVAPTTALTAANYTATQTEFTNYAESTRVVWAQDAEASQTIVNSADKADFTISSGGGTVWGAALVSASAKSATTGTLLCCSKFSASRVLQAADVLTLAYSLVAADA